MRHLIPFNVLVNVYNSLFSLTLIIVKLCGDTVRKAFLKSLNAFKIAQPVCELR